MDAWHYFGDLDLFGLTDEGAEAYLERLYVEALETGGDMQVERLSNQLDTKRYRISLQWTDLARPLPQLLGALLRALPDDHPRMCLAGYEHRNGERQDLVLHDRRVWIVPYEWRPMGAIECSVSELETTMERDEAEDARIPVIDRSACVTGL